MGTLCAAEAEDPAWGWAWDAKCPVPVAECVTGIEAHANAQMMLALGAAIAATTVIATLIMGSRFHTFSP